MISGVEIRRKMVHLATLIIPIGYELTSQETVLLFVIPLFLGLLAVDLLRQFHPGMASLFKRFFFGRVLRENEQPTLMGSTYFLFSTILAVLLFPKSIAVTSLLILILSDTAAALVGKGIGKIHLFGKTLEGSMVFLLRYRLDRLALSQPESSVRYLCGLRRHTSSKCCCRSVQSITSAFL
jgi:dolichol kinase